MYAGVFISKIITIRLILIFVFFMDKVNPRILYLTKFHYFYRTIFHPLFHILTLYEKQTINSSRTYELTKMFFVTKRRNFASTELSEFTVYTFLQGYYRANVPLQILITCTKKKHNTTTLRYPDIFRNLTSVLRLDLSPP
jgi:hypothetical protein